MALSNEHTILLSSIRAVHLACEPTARIATFALPPSFLRLNQGFSCIAKY